MVFFLLFKKRKAKEEKVEERRVPWEVQLILHFEDMHCSTATVKKVAFYVFSGQPFHFHFALAHRVLPLAGRDHSTHVTCCTSFG